MNPRLIARKATFGLGFLLASAIGSATVPGPAPAQELVRDCPLNGHALSVAIDANATHATFMLPGLWHLEQLDLRTGVPKRLHSYRLRGDEGNVSNIISEPRGRWLAAAVNETLLVIEQPSGEIRRTLIGPGMDLLAIATDPKGERIAGGGQGMFGFVIWNVDSGRITDHLGIPDSLIVNALAWSPTGSFIAIAGFDRRRRVLLFDPNRSRGVRTLRGAPSYISKLAFSPQGNLLVAGSGGKAVVAWDPVTGKEQWRTQERDSVSGYSLSFTADGRFLLTDSRHGRLMLLNTKTGRSVLSWKAHSDIMRAEFSAGRPFIVSSGYDKRLKIWNLAKALRTL